MSQATGHGGESTVETKEVFERVARTYDRLNHLFSFNADARWRRRLIASSELTAGRSVLDVCTGTGDVAIAFARSEASARITALDFSENMLSRARAKIDAGGLAERIDLIQGDALALPFDDERFDVVSISFGLRTLADRPRAVRELVRVTKRGGRLLIMEFAPPPATLFGLLYRFYLHRFMPFMGDLLSGYRVSYSYLDTSIAGFPVASEVPILMADAGLGEVESERLTGGIAYLFRALKP